MTVSSTQYEDLGFFNRELGIEIGEWREDFCQIRMHAAEKHLNRSGTLHGGVIASLLDVVGGYAGTWCNTPGNLRRAVTLSMTTQYLAAGAKGNLIAEAYVSGGGHKIYFTDMKVMDADRRVIATGVGNYKRTKGSESLEGFTP